MFPSNAAQRYVTANLNMRNGNSSRNKIVTVIPKGTPIEIDEDCDCKWIPVQYGTHIGYVSSKYLSKTKVRYYNKKRTTRYNLNKKHYYTNHYGERIQSPTYYSSAPSGATALCNDGTYSFSTSRRGTCSHHGGVDRWQ